MLTLNTYGCTQVTACNWDPFANCDDGSCAGYEGCTDSNACNFDPGASCDNGTCIIEVANATCANAQSVAVNGGPVDGDNSNNCQLMGGPGCGGEFVRPVWFSFQYISGTITIEIELLTMANSVMAVYDACEGNQIACNNDFNGLASRIDFNCTDLNPGQTYYVMVGGINGGQGSFNLNISGIEAGCMDTLACNYNPLASCDDSSCEYSSCASCPGDFNNDGQRDTQDLLMFLGVFGSTCAQPGCLGDMNDDSVIDTQDLLAFLAVFGSVCP